LKTEDSSTQIIKLLDQEAHYYGKLGLLLEEQKEIIERKTIDRLLEVIQKVQKFQQTISELDKRIKQYMDGLDDAEREKIINQTKNIRTKIESKILDIISLENYCEDFIEREKIEIKGKISNLKHGKNVIRGYSSSALKNSFISKKF
jgi:hypothetical protein